MSHPFTEMPEVFEPMVKDVESNGVIRIPSPSEGGVERWFKESADGQELWWAWQKSNNTFEINSIRRDGEPPGWVWSIALQKCPCCDTLQYSVLAGTSSTPFWWDGEDENGVLHPRRWVGVGEALTYLKLRRSEVLSANTDA